MTTDVFEAERPRLLALAARVLADGTEAEDVVQQAWLRWHGTDAQIDNLPAWLTTVTSRLCLDRLRVRRPVLVDDTSTLPENPADSLDPADEVVLTGEVGAALALVLDRLSPHERVAFVLHDSFAIEFPAIAEVLDTTPAAARKLASRARAKLRPPAVDTSLADWEVVDAFMAAAPGVASSTGCWRSSPRTSSSRPTTPPCSPARRSGSSGAARSRTSSTGPPTLRCRCSAGVARGTPGSTAVPPRSPSTSPSPGAWSPGWSSGRSPTPWRAWCGVRARTRGPEPTHRGSPERSPHQVTRHVATSTTK